VSAAPKRALIALAALASLLAPPSAAQAAGPPTIEATWVERVTATSALLKAEIDPEGLPTSFRFDYLTEAAYLANGETFAGAASTPTSGAGAGTAPVSVFANLGKLSPTTPYYYRVVATNSAAPGGVAGPAHLLITSEPTNVHPPLDARGWELVSPIDKGGGAVGEPGGIFGGGDFQAAASGESLTYSSASSFAGGAGAPGASQYVSTLGASGWSTANITAPTVSGAYGDQPDGVPYRLFSEDLSRALMLEGRRCEAAQPCPHGYSLRAGSGGLLAGSPEAPDLALAGAASGLAHVVLSSCEALTADAVDGCGAGGRNLYEWSGGELTLINASKGEILPPPFGSLAAQSGAISTDGARVYWYQLEDGPLWLYEKDKPSKALPETTGGAAAFQAASADGSIAFYTVGATLRRYDALSEAAPAIASGVVGVLGDSASGEVVYYQDSEGLKRWRNGVTTMLAAGPEAVAPSDYPAATGTARVSADGEHLAFLSAAEIPPFDNTDAETKQPDTELYLYGPPPGGGPARLICASCNPTGERPGGSATIPGAQVNGTTRIYKPRVLSTSGNRVFFETADSLVVGDTNSRADVYEWEAQGEGDCARSPGCVGLISGGRGSGASFLDASADGADVYFTTEESLIPSDPGSIDAYDYRIGGGFPEPEAPFVCKADACQTLPGEPEDPTPGTLVKNSGNPAQKYFSPHKRKHRKKRHRRRHKHHHGKPRHGGRR
jgi:hypothetical protein